jgi:putative cell wall-binding protein
MTQRVVRRRVGAGVAALVGLTVVAVPMSAEAATGLKIERIGGATRYQTAALVSAANYADGSASTVVLAGGTSTVDALAAAYVAGSFGAPVLLTEPNAVPSETLAELERLGATSVVLAGGDSVIGSDVEDLLAQDYAVQRADGADRYETAALLAGVGDAANDDAEPEVVFVAAGPADAASVSPIAAANHWPILLTAPDEVPAPTAAALENYPNADVVVLGGEQAVSAEVFAAVGGDLRLDGQDRIETAATIADFAREDAGFSSAGFGVAAGYGGADGNDLSDALTAGPALGLSQYPLLLAQDADSLGAATQDHLENNRDSYTEVATVFGGTAVLSDGVVTEVAGATGGTPTEAEEPVDPETPVTPTPTPSTDRRAPVLQGTNVIDGATGVSAGDTFTATYDERLGSARSSIALLEADGETEVLGTKTVSGSTISFDPSTDLVSGAQYTLVIRGFDAAGNAATETRVTFTVAPGAPSAPQELSVVSTSTTAVSGSWTAPASGTTPSAGYEFRYKDAGEDDTTYSAWQDTVGASFTQGGLSAGRTFTFQVRAKAVEGSGAGETATDTATTASTAPTALEVAGVASDGFHLAWFPPAEGAPPNGYEYQVSPTGTSAWSTVESTDEMDASVLNLQAGTSYDARVRAAAGPGDATSAWAGLTTSVEGTSVEPLGADTTAVGDGQWTENETIRITLPGTAALTAGATAKMFFASAEGEVTFSTTSAQGLLSVSGNDVVLTGRGTWQTPRGIQIRLTGVTSDGQPVNTALSPERVTSSGTAVAAAPAEATITGGVLSVTKDAGDRVMVWTASGRVLVRADESGTAFTRDLSQAGLANGQTVYVARYAPGIQVPGPSLEVPYSH